jgi:hypothetical protein
MALGGGGSGTEGGLLIHLHLFDEANLSMKGGENT